MFSSLSKFAEFDKITEFRLKNAFMVAISMSLIAPIIIQLKGIYMLVWVISLFSIAQTLAVKTNDIMTRNFSIPSLYRIGIVVHIIFTLTACLYFISPGLMIWVDSVLSLIEITVFGAYSIVLNNYLAEKHSEQMGRFQIVRNSSWADGALLGLGVVSLITYFLGVPWAIGFFIVYNVVFSGWMISNWNFFNDKI